MDKFKYSTGMYILGGNMKIALTCSLKPENLTGDDVEKYAEFDSKGTISELAKAIEANGHSVTVVNAKDDIKDALSGMKNDIDLVFNVAEGLEGEDREAIVPRICEELQIPFSAAGSETLINTLDKAKTKEILENNGIATSRFQVFENEEDELLQDIHFPLLVKPILEGSSKGIFNENLVDNGEELKKIVKKVVEGYKQAVIVEEFLTGREFTVSVIGYNNPIVLPIVEIKFDHLPKDVHPMDSFEAKWIYDSPEFNEKNKVDPVVCPAEIDDELKKKIEDVVLRAYKVLDCKDWSRIDVRLDKNGVPNILEVNALPGFMKDPKENSRLPKAAYANGWTYEKLIGEVINSAKDRLGI